MLMKHFLSMNENPIKIRQHGKKNSPLIPAPELAKKIDCQEEDAGVEANPEYAVEICVGRVVGGVGQAVEQSVGKERADSGQTKSQRARSDGLKGPLNDHAA